MVFSFSSPHDKHPAPAPGAMTRSGCAETPVLQVAFTRGAHHVRLTWEAGEEERILERIIEMSSAGRGALPAGMGHRLCEQVIETALSARHAACPAAGIAANTNEITSNPNHRHGE